MSQTLYTREAVAEQLAIPPRLLIRYERRGLVRPIVDGGVEGYGPREVRRVWTILSCHRDLGINLAGVEAILRLNEHLDRLHQRLESVTAELLSALDEADRDADDA